MKPQQYVKKYKLDLFAYFRHDYFAVDFGMDFMSRLEVYRTFGNWGVNRYFDLIQEMRKKWEMIDLKCKEHLPEKLWDYIRSAIFMQQFDVEFPIVAEDREQLYNMNAKELAAWINEEVKTFAITNKSLQQSAGYYQYRFYDFAISAAFEWDGVYEKQVIGSLGLKPNWYCEKLKADLDLINDYLLNCAYDELVWQLKKIGAKKAHIQFNIHRKNEQRRNEYWDWWSHVSFVYRNQGVALDIYLPYFEVLGVVPADMIETKFLKEQISRAYRTASLMHHPDKGGSDEKFIELTEAKNKCLEYIARKELLTINV